MFSIVSCTNQAKYTATDLFKATNNNNTVQLNKILASKLSINTQDSSGNSILMLAVSNNKPQLVKYLLSKKIDANIQNNKEVSALDIARKNNNQIIIKLIKAYQYNDWFKQQNKFTEEYFEYGVYNDNTKIVEAFLNNGRNIDAPTISDGLIPIVYALFSNSREVANLLLDKGENPNAGFDTRPILTMALLFNQFDLAKKIINKGANINATEGTLLTPLMIAATKGNFELVKLLTKKGADISLKDQNNETAIDKAKNKEFEKIVTYLNRNVKK